jgi:hypothetical protein
MSNKPNLYWPVYKNLEKEILELSNDIYFDDKQLYVYSIKIADLIFRCSAEIESIAKDIYRYEQKQEPKNPGECFDWMEKEWLISKKQILIATPYFYFEKEFKPSFAPFDYKSSDKNDYYSQYNAIKHDRVKNIHRANINILVRGMAALYLLNIYYKNKEYTVKNDTEMFSFDKTLGSNIFSILIDEVYKVNTQINKLQGDDVSRNMYVGVFSDDQIENIKKVIRTNNEQALKIMNNDLGYPIDVSQHLDNSNMIFSIGNIVGESLLKQKIQNIEDKQDQIDFLKTTDEYNEYIKHNKKFSLDESKEISVIVKLLAIGYYYNKLIHLMSSSHSLIFRTGSKLVLNKNQFIIQ